MIKKSLGIVGAVGLTSALLMMPAQAMPQCSSWNNVSKALQETYQESPISHGVQKNGTVLQVWSSQDGSTWTVTVTAPSGLSCVIGGGSDWHRDPMPIEETGS